MIKFIEKYKNNEVGFLMVMRQKRFSFFKSFVGKIPRPLRILDVGGTHQYWLQMGFANEKDVKITLLNLNKIEVPANSIFDSLAGDATNLSEFKENEFDVVFSNSVIEHLYTLENQKKMASEIRRVAKSYFVQTPNYYFPIEPHFLFPYFQFFPLKIRNKIAQWNLTPIKSYKNYVDEIRLLTLSEMKELFPEGMVYKEKFLGLNKSFVAYYIDPSIV
jgi:ubiquinone/menaquinone biosynthesis C-methylase UbiE